VCVISKPRQRGGLGPQGISSHGERGKEIITCNFVKIQFVYYFKEFAEDVLKFSSGESSGTFKNRMDLLSTPLIETPGAVDFPTLMQYRCMVVSQLLKLYSLQ